MHLLFIDGSYRDGGVTDSILKLLTEEAKRLGASVETVHLRNYPIEFCLNCRECTQQSGSQPGHCVIDDGMHALIEKIETADGLVLASPTNFGTVTAVFKRFMERLVPYAYWPWGTPAPKKRKQGSALKKAVLVTSSAAPSILARIGFNTRSVLKKTAQTVGAKTVAIIDIGMVSQTPDPKLSKSECKTIKKAVLKLI